MGIKKTKLLQTADRLDKFGLAYKLSREFIVTKLGIVVGNLTDSDIIKYRAKIVPGKPGKFFAEFDGETFIFYVTFGSERQQLSLVKVKALGDINKIYGIMKKLAEQGLLAVAK